LGVPGLEQELRQVAEAQHVVHLVKEAAVPLNLKRLRRGQLHPRGVRREKTGSRIEGWHGLRIAISIQTGTKAVALI
jgi:hypothetical protein